MISEESFVESMDCDELEFIARKKRAEGTPKSNRIVKLAEREMNKKLCEPY